MIIINIQFNIEDNNYNCFIKITFFDKEYEIRREMSLYTFYEKLRCNFDMYDHMHNFNCSRQMFYLWFDDMDDARNCVTFLRELTKHLNI